MKSLRFDKQCIPCILGKFLNKAPVGTDPATELDYAKGVLRIIADADHSESAPEIVAKVTAFKNRTFGYNDDFAELKSYYNRLMLSKLSAARQKTEAAKDPFSAALKTALLGNYIDFGALDSVDDERLDAMISSAENIEVDKNETEMLRAELSRAKRAVYLTDNCGEIVMDRLFISEIKRSFPSLKVTAIVRGEPVLNDATLADAEQVGLCDETSVISNGTDIAGTCLTKISPEALAEINKADVIIAKGQGNFETLFGCGLNVYYLFLCKCKLFADRFGKEPCTGMLLNDRRAEDHQNI